MKKLVLLLLIPFAVLAQPPMNVGLSWNNATEYTDGTPLPVEDITKNTLYCGVASNDYQLQRDYPPLPEMLPRETIFVDLNLTYEVEYFCVMTHTASNGKESANSNEVNFIVLDSRVPAAPTLRVE